MYNSLFKYLAVFVLNLVLGFQSFVFSQENNAFAQLKKINDSYRNEKLVTYEVSYNIYANYLTSKAESNTSSIYIKQNDLVLNKGEQTIIFQNTEKLIIVNVKEKKIYVTKPVQDILKNTSLQDIEKTLTKGAELSVIDKDNLKVFTAKFKTSASEYQKIVINVEKKTEKIQKISMFLNEEMKMNYNDPSCKADKPRIEVDIVSSSTLFNEFKSYLKESFFIKKDKNGYVASDNYKGFKVINNIIKS